MGVAKSHLSFSLSDKRMSTLTGLSFVSAQHPLCVLTDRRGFGRSDGGGDRNTVLNDLVQF